MDHKWLKILETDTLRRKYRIHPLVMKNLSSCNQPCQLHFAMLSLFTQFLDDDDINAIRETFQAMDEDNSGQIEIEELEKAFADFKLDEVYEKPTMELT